MTCSNMSKKRECEVLSPSLQDACSEHWRMAEWGLRVIRLVSWRAFSSPVICHPLTPAFPWKWQMMHWVNLGVSQNPMSARRMTSTSFMDNLFLSGKLCLDTALVSRIFLIMNAFFPNLRSEMQDRQWIFLEVWVRIHSGLELWSILNVSLLCIILGFMHHNKPHTPTMWNFLLVKFKNNISISFPKCTLNDLYSINIWNIVYFQVIKYHLSHLCAFVIPLTWPFLFLSFRA